MKKLKYFTILFVFVFSNNIMAQVHNMITSNEIQQVEINGIVLDVIDGTNADVSAVKQLFGTDLSTSSSVVGYYTRAFWNSAKGLHLSFGDTSDTGNNYTLQSCTIKNSGSNLKIKGVTITVGDNISLLGNVQKNSSRRTITFMLDIAPYMIEISYNSSNIVTEINYEVMDFI